MNLISGKAYYLTNKYNVYYNDVYLLLINQDGKLLTGIVIEKETGIIRFNIFANFNIIFTLI